MTAIIGAFLNTEWTDLSPTKRFLLICAITMNWTGTMLALLNKSMARIEENKPLFASTTSSSNEKTTS